MVRSPDSLAWVRYLVLLTMWGADGGLGAHVGGAGRAAQAVQRGARGRWTRHELEKAGRMNWQPEGLLNRCFLALGESRQQCWGSSQQRGMTKAGGRPSGLMACSRRLDVVSGPRRRPAQYTHTHPRAHLWCRSLCVCLLPRLKPCCCRPLQLSYCSHATASRCCT